MFLRFIHIQNQAISVCLPERALFDFCAQISVIGITKLIILCENTIKWTFFGYERKKITLSCNFCFEIMYKESDSLNNKTKQTATPETCTKKRTGYKRTGIRTDSCSCKSARYAAMRIRSQRQGVFATAEPHRQDSGLPTPKECYSRSTPDCGAPSRGRSSRTTFATSHS